MTKTLLKSINTLLEKQEDEEQVDDVPADDAEDAEADGDDEDVGEVAEREGFKKSKKEMYAFGKTRPITLLTKDDSLGGLDITYQYVINPKTGAWILNACLQGQTQDDMVQFTQGDDPTSLAKNLKKKNRITAHQAVEFLKPPADKNLKEAFGGPRPKPITDSFAGWKAEMEKQGATQYRRPQGPHDFTTTAFDKNGKTLGFYDADAGIGYEAIKESDESNDAELAELKAKVWDLDRAIDTLSATGRGMDRNRVEANRLRGERYALKQRIAALSNVNESKI